MHSRGFLDCLQFALPLFQQTLGWLKSPSRTRTCECDPSCRWNEKVSSIGYPWSGTCSDTIYKVPFVASVSVSYTQAFTCSFLFLSSQVVLQRWLVTLNLLLDVEGNPSIPLSPLSPINSCTPVRGFIPPGFSNSSQDIAFQPCGGFQLLLFVANAACSAVEALRLAMLSPYRPFTSCQIILWCFLVGFCYLRSLWLTSIRLQECLSVVSIL